MSCINCEECKHLKSVVYMKLETETLYNSWCGELLPPLTGKPVEVGASLFYPVCNNRSCQTVYSMVGHTNHL